MSFPVAEIRIAGINIERYRIVVSQSASEDENASAKALARYIGLTVGAILPIVSDDTGLSQYEICVGFTNRETAKIASASEKLINDGILIACDGRLFLKSESKLGTRYAVYQFLERLIGWRFYAENCERVLKKDLIEIPADLFYTYSPTLIYRKTDWMLNDDMCDKFGLNAERGIENQIVGFCHTLGRLSETPDNMQPCLTDEKIYQTVLKNVRKQIADNPGCRIISVTQNDNKRFCTCERCQALAEKEGQSGIMLSFVNRLADEISPEYPGVRLLTFAYQYTRHPPKTIRPRDNVIIWLCSIECCYMHPLTSGCEKNDAFVADMTEWSKIAKHVYIWDYTTNYHYYITPFPNFKVLSDNMRFFTAHGAIAVYEEGGYAQFENGEFSQLRAYLLAHLLWDTEMSDARYNELLDDFLDGYYGKGAEYVRRYIDRTCEKAAEHCAGIYGHPGSYFTDTDGKIDEKFVLEMQDLWKKAIDSADSEETRRHCENSSCQIDYIAAELAAQKSGKADYTLNKLLRDKLLKAGVVMHREFAKDQYRRIDGLNDKILARISPAQWQELRYDEKRTEWGLDD